MKLSKQNAVPESETLEYGLSQIFQIGQIVFPPMAVGWPADNAPKAPSEGYVASFAMVLPSVTNVYDFNNIFQHICLKNNPKTFVELEFC